MSGGGGLWFLVRVPTKQHEELIFEKNASPVPNSGTPSVRTATDSCKSESSGDSKCQHSAPLEQILKKSLDELGVVDPLWVLDKDGKYYQVSFSCSSGLRCDLILASLSTNGIGTCKGSSMVVLPCTVLLQEDEDATSTGTYETEKLLQTFDQLEKSDSSSTTLSKTKSEVKKAFRNFKDMQKKFLKTVTARLTVAQVVEGVKAGAELTFDYVMFVLIASMIAALGLLENSSVIIVASMLISPIMGPILAGTFGAVIRDKTLRNVGIKTEILGLFICLFIGYVFGVLGEALDAVGGKKEWPNPEMTSRGQDRSLWIGLLVALPSGAGVALSVLGGNAGSLVGVAISASLLPPAVNAGLLWGMATVRSVRARDEQLQLVRIEGVTRTSKPSLTPFDGYQVNYFNQMDKECAMLGLISLSLALLNIVCIFIAAVAVLKIKEVAPHTNLSRTSRFWKEDIKIARDYNVSMPVSEAEELGKQFVAEWAALNGLEPEEVLADDEEAVLTRVETLRDIMQDVESDEVFQTVLRSVSHVPDTRPISKRLSLMAPTAGSDVAKSERKSGLRSWFIESLKGELSPSSEPLPPDVELRRPRNQAAPRPSHRQSSAVLRQSLMNAPNPYTLWPSVDGSGKRFVVTPVAEDAARRSRFLLREPCIVIKETPC